MIRLALIGALALHAPAIAAGAAAGPAAFARAWQQAPGKAPREALARELAGLTRTALRAPDAFETWAAIARTLAATRPPSRGDTATAAEWQALRAAEAVAAGTDGVITELRLEPRGARTEIQVAITGTARYRLFRRLSDPVDPRLTLEVYDADASLLRARYPALDRGGVRELRVTPTDSGTVQLAIALAGPREFGLTERDGVVIVYIANEDGPFDSWSSRPIAPAITARSAAIADRTPAALAALRALAAAPHGDRADATAAGSGAPAAEQAQQSRIRRAVGAAVAAVAQWRPSLRLPHGVHPAHALGALALLAVLAWIARRGWFPTDAFRRLRRRVRPARTVRAARPTAVDAPAARIGAALGMVSRGATRTEVARRTGLAQDAVLLLARARPIATPASMPPHAPASTRPPISAQPVAARAATGAAVPQRDRGAAAASSSGSGSFFRWRAGRPASGSGGGLGHKLLHTRSL